LSDLLLPFRHELSLSRLLFSPDTPMLFRCHFRYAKDYFVPPFIAAASPFSLFMLHYYATPPRLQT